MYLTSVMGASLADYARIQLLLLLSYYLFSLFRIAKFARTRNLVVPANRYLAMRQSFVVLDCRTWNALLHDMKILLTWVSFVSEGRRIVRDVDASN
jgi:multisubunit Na+/H+ antiporter MnhF subunit